MYILLSIINNMTPLLPCSHTRCVNTHAHILSVHSRRTFNGSWDIQTRQAHTSANCKRRIKLYIFTWIWHAIPHRKCVHFKMASSFHCCYGHRWPMRQCSSANLLFWHVGPHRAGKDETILVSWDVVWSEYAHMPIRGSIKFATVIFVLKMSKAKFYFFVRSFSMV